MQVGCFARATETGALPGGFPAQVGVLHTRNRDGCATGGLSRAGRGASHAQPRRVRYRGASPRRSGCFARATETGVLPGGLPAQVGVFRTRNRDGCATGCLTRAGRGASHAQPRRVRYRGASPRRSGCFTRATEMGALSGALPAQVGVPRTRNRDGCATIPRYV